VLIRLFPTITIAQNLSAAEGSNPFRQSSSHHHDHDDENRLGAFKERLDVDKHAHSDEEKRDENGISHELHPVHQWSAVWYVSVEHQSRKESSQDPFQPAQVGNGRAKHHGSEYE